MRYILLTIAFLIIPSAVFAQIEITEVMYDLDGSDSGREWVEVYNSGSSVDLSNWKLYENDTNHSLSVVSGTGELGSGEYAIIADNTTSFLSDWPNYTGTLFDSAFSLSNTGESIEIRDSNLNTLDTFSYTSNDGANGDGNSLHKSTGAITVGTPTPGSGTNTQSSGTSSSTSSAEPAQTVTIPGFETDFSFPIPSYVGEKLVFEPIATYANRNLYHGYFIWNMGDGTMYQDESISDIHHTYEFPGQYIVTFEFRRSFFGITESTTQRTITISEPSTAISIESDGIVIKNVSSTNLDVSGWIISNTNGLFEFPEHSIISANNYLKLSASKLGFYIDLEISLHSDKGAIIDEVRREVVTKPTVSQQVPPTPTKSSEPKVSFPEFSPIAANVSDAVDQSSSNSTWVWIILLVIIAFGSTVTIIVLVNKNPAIKPDSIGDVDINDIEILE